MEWVDLNIRLTPVLHSIADRFVLSSYLSLNIAGGVAIGLCLGVVALVLSSLKQAGERVLGWRSRPRSTHRLLGGLFAAGVAGWALNQQHHVHRYAIGLIREAEKYESLTQFLLNHERAASYLIVTALVIACSLVHSAARRSRSASSLCRFLWCTGLIALITAAYYADSRIEVQLYENSLHYSLFLIDLTLAMAVVGTLFRSPGDEAPSRRFSRRRRSRFRTGPAIGFVIVAASLIFTFVHFDRDQNLKTQIFYRTTQAKQYFQLARWALDFDRDGYSPYLGGGDLDDRRYDINPSHPEIAGDSIDNNCIAGDLSADDLKEWRSQFESVHVVPDSSAVRMNVIFVFIDALRADHLGLYGYERNTSPNLDRLAARSCVFDNAFTPSPNTFEALPKFMQSAYWDAHIETWPEILSRSGYQSLLFPRRITTLQRHVRGMRVVREARVKTFQETIDKAIEIFGGLPVDQPFAAFLYSTDPHRPYLKHQEFDFGPSNIDLYDGEISYADFQLGRLFDWLEKSGRLDRTMIVIMADHGESLGERSVYKHSTQLYNEQMRVPMIIHFPPASARRISDYVSTVDLGATIVNAVGLDYPQECAGVSLVPLMRGEQFTHPPVYAEQTNQEVSPYVRPEQNVYPESKKYAIVTQDGFKLIYNRNYYTFELFNLQSDPREETNLYDRFPEKAAMMRKLLGRYVDVLTASRPWNADETQFHYGPNREGNDQ